MKMLAGLSSSAAARESGFAEQYGTQLAKDPWVRGRLVYLRKIFLERHSYDAEQWLETQISLATTKITDVVRWGIREESDLPDIYQDDDGVWRWRGTGDDGGDAPVPQDVIDQHVRQHPYADAISSDALPDRVAEAIQSVTVEVSPETAAIKVHVKLHDKLRAQDQLAKYLGLYEQSNNPTVGAAGARTINAEVIEAARHSGLDQMPKDELEKLRRLAWQGRGGDGD